MIKNVGGADRILRFLVGVVILYFGYTRGMPWWTWLGLIPIATALIRWCPAYLPFRISTAKKEG